MEKIKVGTVLIAKDDYSGRFIIGKEYRILVINPLIFYINSEISGMDCFLYEIIRRCFDVKQEIPSLNNELKTNKELIATMQQLSNQLNESWEQLLKQSPTIDDLILVIKSTSKENELIRDQLAAEHPAGRVVLACRSGQRALMAADRLRERGVSNLALIALG